MTIDANISRPSLWAINSLSIVLGGLLTLFYLSEWYTIAILSQTDSYPFGGEGPAPYYYKTAQQYARVNLVCGLSFLAMVIFATWTTIKRQRKGSFLALGLTLLLLTAVLIHGQIGAD